MIDLPESPVATLANEFGGALLSTCGATTIRALSAIEQPLEFALSPLFSAKFIRHVDAAVMCGAPLLVDSSLATRSEVIRAASAVTVWRHDRPNWVIAELLSRSEIAHAPKAPATIGEDSAIADPIFLGPRVTIGRRVTIDPMCVIGRTGFGFAARPDGTMMRVPHLAGVIIEDDVAIGPHCTIDAGVLRATRIRRGAKLDAQVHVGHNVEIGEGTIVAAQSGFAGSVIVGRGVLIGGQVGVADHVRIGDGARIAAKSGVIGDIPAGATVAGYPAVSRARWLRALARLYRGIGSNPASEQ